MLEESLEIAWGMVGECWGAHTPLDGSFCISSVPARGRRWLIALLAGTVAWPFVARGYARRARKVTTQCSIPYGWARELLLSHAELQRCPVRRRDFMSSVLGGAIAVLPSGTRAQEKGRSYRVGSLHLANWDAPHHVAFRDVLRHLGFIEGHNLFIDRDGHGMRREQFPAHAAELVKSNVDVIHCSGMLVSCRAASDRCDPYTRADR